MRWVFAALALAMGALIWWLSREWLFGAIVALVLLPPSLDPAIRIKEWQIKRGWHPESRN